MTSFCQSFPDRRSVRGILVLAPTNVLDAKSPFDPSPKRVENTVFKNGEVSDVRKPREREAKAAGDMVGGVWETARAYSLMEGTCSAPFIFFS